MESHQTEVLARIVDAARVLDARVTASVTRNFISGGRVVAYDEERRTLATLDLDFQERRTRASLNSCVQPCQPLLGARSGTIFWWTPDEDDSADEIDRMLEAWSAAITERLED